MLNLKRAAIVLLGAVNLMLAGAVAMLDDWLPLSVGMAVLSGLILVTATFDYVTTTERRL